MIDICNIGLVRKTIQIQKPPLLQTKVQPSVPPPRIPPGLKPPEISRQTMPAYKPNIVTTTYEGQMGDREYVFACKGRPFCVLTAPQFPTPAFTMIDHNLVRELGIRMTDMQCVKMRYGGQNLRILGKISTHEGPCCY